MEHSTFYKPATQQIYEKVIMVVGATGTGKSTLINRMINYILDIKYTDKFRFQLVIEKETSQIESQTKIITKYVLYSSKFDYKLSVIDTPGFGDTTGKGEDQKTIEKIRSLFDSGTIVSIDAICFVAKYGDTRLKEFEKYVFKNVTNIFGKDVGPNIFVMATSCDDTYDEHYKIQPAPVLEQFKALEIPFQKSFPFNNKDIYKEPVEGKKLTTCIEQWETSTISFKFFFEELDRIIPVSLKLTREVLQRQHNIIHVKLPNFVRKLKQSIHIIDRNKELLKKLEIFKELPEYLDFTVSVEVQKEAMVNITEPGIFCIKCKNCPDVVCHYPCDIPSDKPIKKCSMMSTKWFTKDVCIACPKKCPWIDHERLSKRPGFITVTEKHTKEDLKTKYLGHLKSQEAKLEQVVKGCENDMVSTYGDLLKDLKDTQEDIEFLNKECLSKDPTSLEEKISNIIENELTNQEDGYEKRIIVLQNLNASMKDIFKNFEDASNEDKIKLATKIFYKQM